MAYKIAPICALVFSGIFVLWTFRIGKEDDKLLIKLVSIWIFGIFLAIFPGKSFFLIGAIIVFFSTILIFSGYALRSSEVSSPSPGSERRA